jgi:uncharacterized protein
MLTEPESSLPQSPPTTQTERTPSTPFADQAAFSPEPAPRLRIAPLKARQIPSVAHTLLLLVIAGVTLFVTEIAAFGVVLGTHLFGKEDPQVLLRDPRLLVPSMAISYLIAGALAWAVFTNLWKQPFTSALRWNGAVVQRRFYAFVGCGILLSLSVQLLSNYLPIPKALPIDDFFRTPTDVWIVAVFGTFIAPVFEELAFRGFLFPSLASAWDWVANRNTSDPARASLPPSVYYTGNAALSEPESSDATGARPSDPKWSLGALVFSAAVTSVGFALLHSDQLAHSWAPLLVLFTVSLALCFVRLRAHSLAASILVHASYNGTLFALLFYATDGFRHLDKAG